MTEQRAIGPDLLRGLAILMVAAAHINSPGQPAVFVAWSRPFGWMGVDVFFVLSGYLIDTELLKPIKTGDVPDLRVFYLKRRLRILPVFWLIVAVYFLFPVLNEGPTIAPAWRFLTFTLNFGLDIRTMRSFSHAWSLCVEEHFYLLLPLVCLSLRRVRQSWLPVALALLLAWGGMWLRHALWLVWQADGGNTADFMKAIYYPSYTRFDGLAFGVSLAALRLFHRNAWERIAQPWLTFPAGAVCILIAGYMVKVDGFVPTELGVVVIYPLFALGVTFVLAGLLRVESSLQWLRWSGIGFIAAISYSFYLSQKLVFHADDMWLPKAWMQQGWTAIGIYYVTSIAVAAGLYFAVEQPMLAVRKWALGRLRKARDADFTQSSIQ